MFFRICLGERRWGFVRRLVSTDSNVTSLRLLTRCSSPRLTPIKKLLEWDAIFATLFVIGALILIKKDRLEYLERNAIFSTLLYVIVAKILGASIRHEVRHFLYLQVIMAYSILALDVSCHGYFCFSSKHCYIYLVGEHATEAIQAWFHGATGNQ